MRADERHIRPDSLTSQFRALAKQKPRKRQPPVLEPLPLNDLSREKSDSTLMGTASLQKQVQSPIRLQWLVDDFVKAAGTGDTEKVDQYIRGGIPIDRKHSVLQYSALHAAAALESNEITKVLVQAGANVNGKTKDQDSALHLAAKYGKPAVAQEILRHGVDMKSLNYNGFTPMDIAADRQDHELKRLLEPPPSTPTDVHAKAVSSTSLTIAWRSTCSSSSTYLFKITWVLCESIGEFTDECTSPVYRICNLLPASRYKVTVQAGNHMVGWSAPSASPDEGFCTDGDVPNAMVAPIITEVSESFVRMRLQLPQDNGSEITRVSIQSQCTGAVASVTTASFRRLLKPQDQDDTWESVMSDVGLLRNYDADDDHDTNLQANLAVSLDKEFIATGLVPGCVYYFRAKVFNQSGWSPNGEVSDGICTNDSPKVVHKSARSVTLVWAKPYSTEHIDAYELHARVSTSTQWTTLATNLLGQSLVLQDQLIPSTAYSFRIVPHFALRGGHWEDANKCTCSPLITTDAAPPEPPVDLQVLDRTAQSVTLAWGMPRCNGHVVKSYRVQYRCSNGSGSFEWMDADDGAIAVAGQHQRFVVERLQRGCGYEFRISARNSLGESPFACLDESVWTYRFLPPTAPECVAKNSFSLHLEWHDGYEAHGDEHDDLVYEVQLCQVERSATATAAMGDDGDIEDHTSDSDGETQLQHDADLDGLQWHVAAQDLRERHAVVSGLRPLACYVFRIRASSSSGSPAAATNATESVFSPVSSIFQTGRRI